MMEFLFKNEFNKFDLINLAISISIAVNVHFALGVLFGGVMIFVSLMGNQIYERNKK